MKKVIIGLIVALTLLAGIATTVYLTLRLQELRKQAAPATTLSLSPGAVTKKVGDEFTLEINIDAANNQVIAAEIHLVYDPAKLEAQTITNGSPFPNVLTSGIIDRGTASITVGVSSATSPFKGTGIAAVVKFKALDSTSEPSPISFASNTFVGALGEGSTNVLTGTTPASVTIGQAAIATVTPTQTLSATSSGVSTNPSPSLTPIPLSSLSPSPGAVSLSATASDSAVQILTPQKDNSLANQEPTIQGTAPPGSNVTITIYSEPLTVTVTTDADGNWSYTPQTPLEPGPHNIVASAQDPTTGITKTATTTFVIASGGQETATGSSDLTTGTQSATPVSGNIAATVMLLVLGGLFLIIGATLQFATS